MKHGKNCWFFAPQKSIRWRSELVFGLKESILAQLSPWSAKWHQDSLQVSENLENFSKVNEAAAAYMVIAEGLKWLTKFSAWCCWACDLTYALDNRSCRRKITRLADSSERPTPGLSSLFVICLGLYVLRLKRYERVKSKSMGGFCSLGSVKGQNLWS